MERSRRDLQVQVKTAMSALDRRFFRLQQGATMINIQIVDKHNKTNTADTLVPSWLWAGINDKAKSENISVYLLVRRALKQYIAAK